jgi:CMP-N-acetylneuraminic acid synthetase
MYPEFAQKRTQDLEPAYYDAGQFYWGKTEAWNSNLHVHSWAKGYEIPNSQVVDIDTEEDWSKAEFLFLALKNRD